jgi:catechol 2,3-dioxygenase
MREAPIEEVAMSSPIRPQLSHAGIYTRDVGNMVDFYTRILGLVVSDRGPARSGGEIVFLTAHQDHHHQVVLVSGRSPDAGTTVQQLSFKVADLDQVKTLYRRVVDYGIGEIRQVTHGNALSFYFPDPEGNTLEVYMDTPWYVPQPHGVPIDLALPNEDIIARCEEHCRATPGFLPLDQWQGRISDRLGKA